MVGNDHERPLTFRAHNIEFIIRMLRAGKSCILVGVDGIGKTSLMRHLVSPTVREQYLGEDKKRFIFLPLNAHELTRPSALAYYCHMALLLEPTLADYQLLSSLNKNPLTITNEEVAKQLLFDGIEAILSRCKQSKLVFVFDEFDVAFTETEPQFFRVLQALRMRAAGRVCYVAVSKNVPALICDPQSRKVVREMFPELFNGNISGIRPLEEPGAYEVIEQGLAKHGKTFSPSLRRFLLEVTGAHPGMLTAVTAAWKHEMSAPIGRNQTEAAIHTLLQEMTVVSQCEQIWYSLSEVEQQCMKQVPRGLFVKHPDLPPYTPRQIQDALQALVIKGILREEHHNGKIYQCFSPLFASYVAQQFSARSPGLQLDFSRQQVWIDGTLCAGHLTPKEFQLLRFLAEHAGEICSREETTWAVYGETYDPKSDDARLDALVERTRKSIGDDSRPPRFLETVRGVGHRLKEYLGEPF
jgi:hypothetical protein